MREELSVDLDKASFCEKTIRTVLQEAFVPGISESVSLSFSWNGQKKMIILQENSWKLRK